MQKISSINFSFSIFLLLFISLSGCKPAQKTAQTVKTDTKSLLWKIEGKNLQKPSYLFGTIHLIPKEKYLFNTVMNKAFSEANEIVLELDMNEMSDIGKMMEIFNMAKMPNGMTLRDVLSEEDYNFVRQKYEALGLPFMMFENMKPLFLSAMGEDMSMNPLDDGYVSYEMLLTEKANEQNKIISGIESVEEQMAAVDSIPLTTQAQLLMESLRSKETTGFDDLVELYLQQDVEALQQEIDTENDGVGSNYMKFLLEDRNHRWINRMEEKMKKHQVFFAVGAGHLGGEQGVINLLRRAGYILTPVKESK